MNGEIAATVVICVRNRPDQLRDCLLSLAATTGVRFETVVVDDASTDDTAAVAETIAGLQPYLRLRVIRNSRNLGVSGARNVGIDAARGPIVAFTDSDCVVAPEWLAGLCKALEGDGVAGAAGTVHEECRDSLAERAFAGTSAVGRSRWQARPLIGCNMALRTSLARTFRFDPLLAYYCDEDDIALRLRRAGWRFAFVPGAEVHHRHRFDLRSLLGLAWRQGRGSARFWAKQRKFLGRDVLGGSLALATLPLAVFNASFLAVPLLFLALQVTALLMAEVRLKGKSCGEALRVLPVVALHNAVKTASVLLRLPGHLLHPPPPDAPRESPGPGPAPGATPHAGASTTERPR